MAILKPRSEWKRVGRPSTLSAVQQAEIERLTLEGVPYISIAALLGINDGQAWYWQTKILKEIKNEPAANAEQQQGSQG